MCPKKTTAKCLIREGEETQASRPHRDAGSLEPGNASQGQLSQQNLDEAGKVLPRILQKDHSSVTTSTADFLPPELYMNTFPLL